MTGPNRGFFVEGNGFVEANSSGAGLSFLTNYLGVGLANRNYMAASGNIGSVIDVIPTSVVDPVLADIYGVRNACTSTLDVLKRTVAPQSAIATYYIDPASPGSQTYPSGIEKPYDE